MIRPPPTAARPASPRAPSSWRRLVGLLSGALAAGAMLLAPAPEGMSAEAWRVAALVILMATWWVWEAIPIAATALAPIALLPLLDVMEVGAAAAPYANPLIFLFLGGFCIAAAMERWGLHRRAVLPVLVTVGGRPDRIVGGFMLATAVLSMWVSNTATATMMLPIAVTVSAAAAAPDDRRFPIALLLGIAYGANIGGMATLIGTPPNALFAGYMREAYGIDIGFGEWMLVGLPFSLFLLLLGWLLLTRVVYRLPRTGSAGGGEAEVKRALAELGPMSRGERMVLAVFLATAALWILRPALDALLPVALSDAGIAVLAALILFSLPVDPAKGTFVLDWTDTAKLPWGVLILVGGGLSLGAAVESSGLSQWVAGVLAPLSALPAWAAATGIGAAVMVVSHITSNTATAATFLPLAGSFAAVAGVDAAHVAAPVALAASCAFMMPVATPPNAIVFATGQMAVLDMVRAGALLNLLSLALLPLAAMALVPLVL